MEQLELDGINIGGAYPASLLQDFSNLGNQIQTGGEFSADPESIEREANFVDEVILNVGKQKKYTASLYHDIMSTEYFSSLENPAFCLQTREERVELMAKYFKGISIPQEVLGEYHKNSETSRLLLNRGTELYKLKNCDGALHYYNLALMFAEEETQAVGFAYANRAAVLVSLGHFEEAILDVELALKNKYPESQTEKLVKRKERCEKAIRKQQEEYLTIQPEVRKEIEDEVKKIKAMSDEMFRLQNPNPLIPAAADFVEIKYDSIQGRHLAVNQDTPAGTVLLVEDPYMFILYGQSKWHTYHCHHCLRRIWRGVPCGTCVFAVYCSASCQREAKTIHRFECSCLPTFHSMCIVDQLLLAVRVILKIGPTELFRLFQHKDPAYDDTEPPLGTEPNCMYDSKSYQTVCHLITHPDKLPVQKLVVNVLHALMGTSVLENETDFFEDVPAESKMEFKNFVAALILRHIEAARTNAAAAMEVEGLENVPFAESYSGKIPEQTLAKTMDCVIFRKFAPGFYPLFSLINHSCDPNVYYFNHKRNGTMVVVAHRALKKGEPVLLAYSHNFFTSEIGTRQTYLEHQHHFKCTCVACELKWPTLPLLRLSDPEPKLCCPVCSKTVFQYEKGSNEFKRCLLAAPYLRCGRCCKIYTIAECNKWIITANELSSKILRLFKLNRARQAHELIPRVIDFLQFHKFPPNGQLWQIQDLLVKTMAIICYYAQE